MATQKFNAEKMQNVTLDNFSDAAAGGRYDNPRTAQKASLACEYDGARFHVWINPQTWAQCTGYLETPLYKNCPRGTKTTDAGYFPTRHLNPCAAFGHVLIEAMIARAQVHNLRETAARAHESDCARERAEATTRAWETMVKNSAFELLECLQRAHAPGATLEDVRDYSRALVRGIGPKP